MTKKISLWLAVLLLVMGLGWPFTQADAKSDKAKNTFKWSSEVEIEVEDDEDEDSIDNEDEDSDSDDEDSDQDDDRLPFGLRHAPGIEKRIENGKGLPFGWWWRLFGSNNGNATSTPTKVLTITKIETETGTSTAMVSWQTNKAADSQIIYGTTTPLVATSSATSSNSLVTNHSLSLTGLTPATVYYYQLISSVNSQTATSSIHQFTTDTLPAPDNESPEIIFSTVIGITDHSARFIWVTDEASDSRLWLGTSTPVDTTGTTTASNSNRTYYHDLTATGLTASTSYAFVLASRDAASNVGSTTGSFLTEE